MTTLTGKKPASTYKDLLQVSNANSGIDATKRPLSDGEGTNSTLELSTTKTNISSGFQLGGVDVTATAADLNSTIAPYTELFNSTTDWGIPSGGGYTITITAITHGFGLNVSSITVFEIIGSDSIVNTTGISINNITGDVSITAEELPDNRFAGKIIIA